MLLQLTLLVLLSPCFGADDGKDAKLRPMSSSNLLRPSVVIDNRNSANHVFDFVGQELVDTRYDVSWLHLIQSSLKSSIDITMDTSFVLSFNYTIVCTSNERLFRIQINTMDNNVLTIQDTNTFLVSCKNSTTDSYYNIATPGMPTTIMVSPTENLLQRFQSSFYYLDGKVDIKLASGVLGRTSIEFVLDEVGNVTTIDANGQPITEDAHREVVHYPVSVLRKVRPVDRLFRVVVYCMQVFVMVGFGIKLDIKVVKEHLWKPVAPIMGLCCQYIMMPLIAFGVAKGIHIESEIVALGIFIAGCCPGGGGSNMYSYLLKGNLSLSITMTAISTVAALGMLPLWVYTLGYTFLQDQDLQIPFSMVAVSLSILITPLVIGIFLRQKLPKVAKKIQKLLKPVILVMSLLLIVLGVYSNLYIFRLFKPRTVLAACLLPYIGYIAGGTIALVSQRDWRTVKTIAIETGMQNTSIAYILMTSSFPAPEGDIGSIAPLASAVMTPIPLFIITVIYVLYGKMKKKYAVVEQTDELKDETNNDNHELDDKIKA